MALTATWAASAAQPDDQNHPAARAYFSYPFGGPAKSHEPAHYGLRLDMQNRLNNYDGYLASLSGTRAAPAVAQLDFDTGGNRIASLSGIPFAGRRVMLRQNEGDGSTPSADTGGSGGFTFFDWSLLVVGIGGAGYLIYQVADNKDDSH